MYLADEFFSATPRELADAGCAYENIIGAHEHSGDYTCSFIYPLGPQLISQGYVQFSLATQLIFILFLQYTCLLAKILLLDQNSTGTIASNALSCAFSAGIEFFLNVHQFMIMLPLTAVLPNPFCAHVQVPVETEKAICLFKIAAAMLPYGVPSFLGGCCIIYVAFVIAKSGRKNNNVLMYFSSFLVGMVGLYFFATGLCMIIFWIFGCMVLGSWYSIKGFSLSYSTSETALLLNLMKCSPFLFSFFDVVLFPLPLKDENSFYHASYKKYSATKDFVNKLYTSEPCCVDMCTWIWVRISTCELFLSEKFGSCWDTCYYCCCHRPKINAQIACEDIVLGES